MEENLKDKSIFILLALLYGILGFLTGILLMNKNITYTAMVIAIISSFWLSALQYYIIYMKERNLQKKFKKILKIKLKLIKKDCKGVLDEIKTKDYIGFKIKAIEINEFLFRVSELYLNVKFEIFEEDLIYIEDKIKLINEKIGESPSRHHYYMSYIYDIITKELEPKIKDVYNYL